MGGARELHRSPWLIEAEIADDFWHPRAPWLSLEGGCRNASDGDRRGGCAGNRAADGGAPVWLILEGKRCREAIAECRRVGEQVDGRIGTAQTMVIIGVGVEIEH